MKIASAAADGFARAPSKSCVLVYGPDQGLMRERSEALRESVLGADIADPFRSAEVAGQNVAARASILVDEAAALSLTGGRRVVRVIGATDGAAEAFAAVLKMRTGRAVASESLVVAEAGELGPRSALRRLFEESPDAAALPCYVDDGEGLTAVADGALRTLGHTAEPGALAWIARAAAGDRSVLRRELEKLSVYVGPSARVTAADAEACLGEAGAAELDDAALAAATGDLSGLDLAIGRSFAAGHSPIMLLRSIGRELSRVHQVAGLLAGGVSERSAFVQLRPPVFFRHEPAYRRALQMWQVRDLERALGMVAEAELQCKSGGVPDEPVAWRAALRIANAARQAKALAHVSV